MRKRVGIEGLKPGMVVAETVFHGSHVLLDRGVRLTEEFIKQLEKRNIKFVYIEKEDDAQKLLDEIGERIENSLGDEDYLREFDKFDFSNETRAIAFVDRGMVIGTDRIITKIAQLAYKSEGNLRNHICRILMGKTQMLSDLYLRGIKSSDKEFKKICIEGLKTSANDEHIKTMLLSMRTNPEFTNFEIIEALKDFAGDVVKKEAYDLLKMSEEIVPHMINVLSQFEPPEVIENLKDKYMKRKSVRPKTPETVSVASAPVSEQNTEPETVVLEIEEKKVTTEPAQAMYSGSDIRKPEIKDSAKLKEIDFESDFAVNRDEEKILFQKPDISDTSLSAMTVSFNQSIEKIGQVYSEIYKDHEVNSAVLSEIVCRIIHYAKTNMTALLEFTKVSTISNYVLGHSLNVTVFSIILGVQMKWDENKLTKLGVACLLHDIGMIKVENLVWNENKQISPDERFEIMKHSIYGIDSLKMNTRFGPEICFPAYYHHERMDGSGYPKGKKGAILDEFSRLIGLMDSYCALTSNRVWRNSFTPKEAIATIMGEYEKYDRNMLVFLQKFLAEHIDRSISFIQPGDARKVLLVDDQEEILVLLSNLLSMKGYKVFKSYSANDALSKLNSFTPDVILLDIMMPIVDGFDAIKHFRKHFDKIKRIIPIIFVTARRDAEAILRAKNLGITDYIIKPFTSNVLINKIESVLEKEAKGK